MSQAPQFLWFFPKSDPGGVSYADAKKEKSGSPDGAVQ
jgi:hypothetical protein